MKKVILDEKVSIWRRSSYLLNDDEDSIQVILNKKKEPVDVDYINAYQEPTAIEIYNGDTWELLYTEDSEDV